LKRPRELKRPGQRLKVMPRMECDGGLLWKPYVPWRYVIQGAYKLSEYFAKPYFHKYWIEIHDVFFFIITCIQPLGQFGRNQSPVRRPVSLWYAAF
jgi:hypothetical protein